MDDIVKQAMLKWPQVPDCYGWLGLDSRGDWYMRDDRTQALGAFASGVPGAKGSRLLHDKLIAFINRNYLPDAQGRWFFQNGPQRVYVELESTPQIWRLADNGEVHSHTGQAASPLRCLTDEAGHVYLLCSIDDRPVLGLVHTQDMLLASNAIEDGRWQLESVNFAELPEHFGYQRSPAAQA